MSDYFKWADASKDFPKKNNHLSSLFSYNPWIPMLSAYFNRCSFQFDI